MDSLCLQESWESRGSEMTVSRKLSLGRNHLKLSRLGIVVSCVLVFFIFMLVISHIADSIWLNENISEPYVESSAAALHIIRKDVTECLTKFSQNVTDQSSFLLNNTMKSGTQSSTLASKEPFTMSVLSNFNNLISSLNIKSAVIEPSIIYCMITDYYQEILLKRNFNITDVTRSKSIVTYGIFEHDAVVLQREENVNKFREAGFLPEFVANPVVNWMQEKGTKSEADTFVSHIFYKSPLYTIHVVVFYKRGNYLWHAALDSNNNMQDIPQKAELLFADYNGAYEKFTFLSLDTDVLLLSNISIPSPSHYFLFEMLSSRFLECNVSRAGNEKLYSNQPKSPSQMSVDRFKKRTHIVLHQLKSIFHPLLMNLWIWGGTMLGWRRQCGIIPYTTDVDFAAWASEVENLDRIINLLLNNEHAKIKERMGMLEEALEFNINCHGLRSDVFFLYSMENGTWCAGHRPSQGYYFRYHYPHFTLCSADLLGEKVQVACETEEVIMSEYGPGWNKPVSKWNYESSVHNRGPNKYWDKKALKHAYTAYN